MKSYNKVDDLRRKLRFMGDEFSETDLQEELEEANRKINVNIGKYYRDVTYVTNLEQKTYRLNFSPIIVFDRVFVSTSGELDSDKYVVSEEKGIITFEDGFDEGTKIICYYVPEVFKDLELLYATQSIMAMNLITTSDNMIGTKTEQINTYIDLLEKKIQKAMKGTPVRIQTSMNYIDSQDVLWWATMRIEAKNKENIQKELLRIAHLIRNEAVIRCPVDTGRLRASIIVSEEPNKVIVGTNVKYAPHVEYGTYKMNPQPFMRPAYDLIRSRL